MKKSLGLLCVGVLSIFYCLAGVCATQVSSLADIKKCQAKNTSSLKAKPGIFVNCVTTSVLRFLDSKNDEAFKEMQKDGINVFKEFFDFARMSAIAFGPRWRDLSIEQRKEFIAGFEKLLFKNYSTSLMSLDRYQVSVLDSSVSDRQAIVRTLAKNLQSGDTKNIDYYLLFVHDRWFVYDVSVSGIGLITTYRQQLQSLYQKGGFKAVIKFLEQANKEKANHVGMQK